MPGKVFVSCGQRPDEMREVRPVMEWLKNKGFEPFVALAAQSLNDIDSGTIEALRSADYFVFIDFKREQVACEGGVARHRGSLYAHQELALAYAFGFPRCIFLREEGVENYGMGAFIQVNPMVFSSRSELLAKVQDAVSERDWTPDYSRQLVVGAPSRTPDPYLYTDGTTYEDRSLTMLTLCWAVTIENRRSDQPAFHTEARFLGYTDPDGQVHDSRDRTPLKWGGARQQYDRTIFPRGSADLDVLAIDIRNRGDFYLHSKSDIHPRRPILRNAAGVYELRYEVCSFGFPQVNFVLRLTATGDPDTTQLVLI